VIDHYTTRAVFIPPTAEEPARLRLVDEAHYRLKLAQLKLEPGDEVEIRVEKLAAARTSAQNRNYWGFIVRPVAAYSLNSDIAIHQWFKADLLPAEKFVLADPKTGEVKLTRDFAALTTTTLSEQQFSDYMEEARALAMETTGIDLSDRGLEAMGFLRG
jgi:hypothetical protein